MYSLKNKYSDQLKKYADELSDAYLISNCREESQVEEKYNKYISSAIECILKAKLCLKEISI